MCGLKDLPVSVDMPVSTEDVLSFIRRRWSGNANWLTGNCLWFAQILKARFPVAEICFLGIEGHFIVRIGEQYFDWTGVIVPQEKVWTLEEIRQLDSNWYAYLMRDCFM